MCTFNLKLCSLVTVAQRANSFIKSAYLSVVVVLAGYGFLSFSKAWQTPFGEHEQEQTGPNSFLVLVLWAIEHIEHHLVIRPAQHALSTTTFTSPGLNLAM